MSSVGYFRVSRDFIAVGGWTFNDPGPTATVFSDIACSEENTKKFIDSVLHFLNAYDFDGTDLDWEYPKAEARSRRPEDYANFPKLIKKLKESLKTTSGRGGLSIESTMYLLQPIIRKPIIVIAIKLWQLSHTYFVISQHMKYACLVPYIRPAALSIPVVRIEEFNPLRAVFMMPCHINPLIKSWGF
jgi:hypothetical protein